MANAALPAGAAGAGGRRCGRARGTSLAPILSEAATPADGLPCLRRPDTYMLRPLRRRQGMRLPYPLNTHRNSRFRPCGHHADEAQRSHRPSGPATWRRGSNALRLRFEYSKDPPGCICAAGRADHAMASTADHAQRGVFEPRITIEAGAAQRHIMDHRREGLPAEADGSAGAGGSTVIGRDDLSLDRQNDARTGDLTWRNGTADRATREHSIFFRGSALFIHHDGRNINEQNPWTLWIPGAVRLFPDSKRKIFRLLLGQ